MYHITQYTQRIKGNAEVNTSLAEGVRFEDLKDTLEEELQLPVAIKERTVLGA